MHLLCKAGGAAIDLHKVRWFSVKLIWPTQSSWVRPVVAEAKVSYSKWSQTFRVFAFLWCLFLDSGSVGVHSDCQQFCIRNVPIKQSVSPAKPWTVYGYHSCKVCFSSFNSCQYKTATRALDTNQSGLFFFFCPACVRWSLLPVHNMTMVWYAGGINFCCCKYSVVKHLRICQCVVTCWLAAANCHCCWWHVFLCDVSRTPAILLITLCINYLTGDMRKLSILNESCLLG